MTKSRPSSLVGVNLGGWLIPERWLTPAVFSSPDAHDLQSLLKTESGRSAYRHHVATFLTESDFAWMAQQGIELVRLPVGYWDFQRDESYISTRKNIDWAVKMAEKYHLKVLLDLHAAEGSQNGYDHSGKSGDDAWWGDPEGQYRTVEVLVNIANRYGSSPALWGIEILNEPRITMRRYFALLRFYRAAYDQLTRILRPGTTVVFHDAFHPLLLTGALRARRGYPVALDTHWYGIPTKYVRRLKLTTYLRIQRLYVGAILRLASCWQPVIVGEWSAVAPQDYMDAADQADYAAIWQANGMSQARICQKYTAAHIYWTYKGEGRGVWHFRSLVEDGTLVVQ